MQRHLARISFVSPSDAVLFCAVLSSATDAAAPAAPVSTSDAILFYPLLLLLLLRSRVTSVAILFWRVLSYATAGGAAAPVPMSDAILFWSVLSYATAAAAPVSTLDANPFVAPRALRTTPPTQ